MDSRKLLSFLHFIWETKHDANPDEPRKGSVLLLQAFLSHRALAIAPLPARLALIPDLQQFFAVGLGCLLAIHLLVAVS